MTAILRQRDIIDRRALGDALAGLAAGARDLEVDRGPVVGLLKAAMSTGVAEIRQRFESGNAGAIAVREHCFLMDQLVRVLYDFTTTAIFRLANPTAAERLSIVAVGGYGRGELAPQSDVDLLF